MRANHVRAATVVIALIVAAMGQASPSVAVAGTDVVPPVTTATVTPTPDYGGYYYEAGSAITVVLSATDTVAGTPEADGSDSGVASTEYRLNNGPWTPYGSALELLEPVGEYVLDYRSTDGLGNVEDAKSTKFGVAELPLTPLAGVPGTPFSDGGSWIYHYPSRPEPYDYSGQTWAYDPTTLTSIIADLQTGWYTDRGITNLMMYGPYWATGEYRGLPALRDFMDIDPEIGTIKEWRDMVSLANSQGITVTTYLAVPYIHVESTLFVKAQEDRRDDVMSFERSIFRWDERVPEGSNPPPEFGGTGTPPSNASVPRPSQGNWAWSPIANRWYATAWEHPAIDFEGGGMEFMKSVVRFWMDNGVQGIEWDAPQSVWGLSNSDARHREIVTYANTYRPDWENYIHGEGLCTFGNQAICDRAGHTHILLNGDDDFNSFATRVGRIPQTLSPDQLDLHWQSFHDHRQLLGRGTYSWSLYDYDVAPGLRALDAAVQAGSGAQYSIDFPMMVRNPKNDVLPESTLELVWDVHRALRNSPALSPSASRERVLTNIDQGSGNFRGYSVLRRSADTDDTALNVYNFNDAEKCVTLDLTGTGIAFPQRTTDIATGEPGPWILSGTPTIRLPAYGWQFLDVSAGSAFPWTIVDDLDSSWTWGSVWAQVTDASALGGTRRHGNGTTVANAPNAWGEITFSGRSVQGYGRMATGSNANTGATTAVEVFIDGVSQGIHSQRRPNNEGTSNGERQGRQLFSISGLAPGEHTLRIQQVSTTTANGGPSGIDYIKVSDQDYVASVPPTGGDRCQSDVTPPVTTLHGEVLGGAPGVSISLDVNDPDPEPSGVARVEYRINGGAWIEYEHVPFDLTTRGSYAVDFRSIDVAGNVEETQRTTVFLGTNGNDTISGTAGDDLIVAGGGNNTIHGSGGNDEIHTGAGNDKITTGNGNDTINAGSGNNEVNAGDGVNEVTTGAGNDKITTGNGSDTINAGSGNNEVNAGGGTDQTVAGDGNDMVDCGPGSDTANVGSGSNTNVGDRCEVFVP